MKGRSKETVSNTLILHLNDEAYGTTLQHGGGTDNAHLDSKDFNKYNSLNPINSNEIMLLAHSSESQKIFSNARKVGAKSAKKLANEFNDRYSKNNKHKLNTVCLFSCEAGYYKNDAKESFSQQFSTDMHNNGFTNLTTYAFTPPQLSQPVSGMIVNQVTTSFKQIVNVWCYRNNEDEKEDSSISEKLNTIEVSLKRLIQTKKLTTEQTSQHDSLLKQRNSLLDRQAQIRLYVCAQIHYSDAIKQEHNKFNKTPPKKQMSEETSLAITYLNRMYQSYDLDTKNNAHKLSKITEYIKKLQNAASLNKEGILKICSSKQNFPDLQNNISKFIDDNKGGSSKKTKTYEDSQQHTDTTFSTNARSSWGIIAFFKYIASIIANISKQQPSPEFKTKINKLEAAYSKFNQTKSDQDKVDKDKAYNNIKDELINKINTYLNNHPKDTTNENSQRNQKRKVMEKMRDYLDAPLPTVRSQLKRITDPSSELKLWDKGFRSQVRLINEEVEKLAKIIEENQTPKKSP